MRSDRAAQAYACALGYLAVLLSRPPEVRAAGFAALAGQLRCDYAALIATELAQCASDLAQIVARRDLRLNAGTSVDHVHGAIGAIAHIRAGERDGLLERRLQRAAPAQRSAPVSYARDKAQLDGIRDVRAAREHAAAADVRDQLEARLAVAVLQVLTTQAMTVDIEQEISSRAGHERDLLHKIGRSRSSRKRWFVTCCSFVAATSGRHTGMSPATANTPPSQFLPSADIPVAVPPRTRPR